MPQSTFTEKKEGKVYNEALGIFTDQMIIQKIFVGY